MAWNDIKVPSGSGDILKLESGKQYRVRIVGEPYVYQSEFDGKLSTRYAMTIWNQETKEAQILMLPAGTFREILGYATNEEDWGDPEMYDFVIKKTGSGLETRYTIQPSPKKEALSDEDKALVTAIDLGEVLKRLPSVNLVFKASEMGEDSFPKVSKKEAHPSKTIKAEDVVIEDISDEAIDLSDIPF